MEVPHLVTDERFLTNALRVANRGTLVGMHALHAPALHKNVTTSVSHVQTELLTGRFRTKTTSEWCVLLETSVACAPINSIGQALSHPQVQHRGMVQVWSRRSCMSRSIDTPGSNLLDTHRPMQEVEHSTIGKIKLVGMWIFENLVVSVARLDSACEGQCRQCDPP